MTKTGQTYTGFKILFGTLENSDFEFVSDFDIRISDFLHALCSMPLQIYNLKSEIFNLTLIKESFYS